MRCIDANKLMLKPVGNGTYLVTEEAIMNARTFETEPVRRGHWIFEREPNGKPYCYHCSACDDDFTYIGITVPYDFCPNCGAKMKGVLSESGYVKMVKGLGPGKEKNA